MILKVKFSIFLDAGLSVGKSLVQKMNNWWGRASPLRQLRGRVDVINTPAFGRFFSFKVRNHCPNLTNKFIKS